MTQPEITVVIPCYNGYRYMDRCWDALEHQTYQNFKVIVVDDCSTDDTLQYLHTYCNQSNLDITILHNEHNQRSAKSRQIGVLAADTEWIAFCDCDDWYEYEFLEKMIFLVKTHEADLAMCNANIAFQDGRKVKSTTMDQFSPCTSKTDYLALSPMSLCRCLFRRELHVNLVIPEISNAEDGAVLPQLMAKCQKITSTTEALYNYYTRPNSLSMAPTPQTVRDFITAYSTVQRVIQSSYHKECEIIGVKLVCYGAVLNALKAGVSTREIKTAIIEFQRNHPTWIKNPYIHRLPTRKRWFLFLVRAKCFTILRLYANLHQFCTSRNVRWKPRG